MADKFEVLNDREHTLRKSHIMVGGTSVEDMSTYINGTYKTLKVTPGLLVITREIIDNSVDEFIRSGFKAATKIDIEMNQMSLTVTDNGRGIPIERYKNDDGIDNWRPVLCWTQLRAGTSFSEHDLGPSSNGVGASVANILSLYFCGKTWDGKKQCMVTCSNNMSEINVSVIDNKEHARGTYVYIEPDFERFGVDCYTADHILATKERIAALSSVYPEITFTFNGEKIRTRKPKEYIEKFDKKYVSHEAKNYFFAVMPTELDEYYQLCYIDGLYIKNGGTHEAYVSREISYALRDIIKKKYKLDMSPGEIKRGLFLLFNGRFFPQMKFDSQTKERLTNSESEVRNYLGDVNFEKIAKDIVSVPDIINPIIEAKLAKQIAAEKRAVTLAQKKLQKIDVEKHVEAKSKNRKETILFLSEGDCLAAETKIKCVDNEGNIHDTSIKDINIGDYVLTHNHQLKQVINKNYKIKDSVKIVFGDNKIVCSPEHRFLVYDTVLDIFDFKEVKDIDITTDKLVRSRFFDDASGFMQIENIKKSRDSNYDITIEADGFCIQSTFEHIFVKFDTEKYKICKVQASELRIGDYIAYGATNNA